MSRMTFEDLYHDRRPPERQPQPESRPEQIEQDAERIVQPEMMGEDLLVIRVPSAIPGPGALVLGRQRDRDACAHCGLSLISHGAGSYHIFEPMPGGRRTPGVHHSAETGRARNAAGPQPTPRFDID